MKKILSLLVITLLFNCNSNAQKTAAKKETFKVTKTDAEWKAQLTAEQYYVMRKAGTERAFSSTLNKNEKAGTYHCAACNTPLFKSEHK